MNDRVTIRISADLAEALDRFVATDVALFRSRQDAFRHIVGNWLISQGHMPVSNATPSAEPPLSLAP